MVMNESSWCNVIQYITFILIDLYIFQLLSIHFRMILNDDFDISTVCTLLVSRTNAYICCISFLQVPLLVPVLFVLGCVFMIVVSFWAAPVECLIGSSIILTGIPAYLLGYKWKKPHVVKKMLGELDIL